MKNLTLRIDENTLAEARKRAALEGTTVAKLVRDYITNFARGDGESPTARQARMQLVERARGAEARASDWEWNRDEIYTERMEVLRKRRGEPGFAEPALPYEDQAMLEQPAGGPLTLEEMTTDTGAPPEAGHDEWFRRQVQKALDDKKAGKSDYVDFDKVATKFGFNAR